ncbi:abscission/NoCut checkpoint regulator-like [Diadema antillarum]|uniref:abscission/NoCut checkpoint regulator-like n=1 Tax=Diadema antillarum TaxID=105358 RepID=UPI003A87C9C6
MDGRCFGCATKFGFFTKEHSCHNCGHIYCKNCLPHKAVIPKRDPTQKQNVCRDCYKLLQNTEPDPQKENRHNEARYSPPENFKKRVAALQQREQTGTGGKSSMVKGQIQPHLSSSQGKPAAKYKNLSPQDREIAMRLEKLQEDRKKKERPGASESEIEERLRKLKGLPPASQTGQQRVLPQAAKTMEEQYDDLLDQMAEEAALDAKLEGREIPQPGPMASSHAPNPGHSHLSQDPLIPSQEELQQLSEDAKKLLGGHPDNSEPWSQPANGDDEARGGGGGGGEKRDPEEDAKRLAEEAKKLMEEAKMEIAQEEESAKKDAAISDRLAQLQQRDPSSNKSSEASYDVGLMDDEDEEQASQRLIKQLLEESKLDDNVAADGFDVPTRKPKDSNKSSQNTTVSHLPESKMVDSDPDRSQPAADLDELPWCCICNEDATLRCLDCDGDLYCKRCFREGHRDYGIESHEVKAFKPSRK